MRIKNFLFLTFLFALNSVLALDYQNFQKLTPKSKTAYLNSVKSIYLNLTELEPYKLSSSEREFLYRIETFFINNAYADAAVECFYGGWPSIVKNGYCQRPDQNNANPFYTKIFESKIYQDEKNCQGVDHIMCNPILFGGPHCIDATSRSNVNNFTKLCEDKSKEKGAYGVFGLMNNYKDDFTFIMHFKDLWNQTASQVENTCQENSTALMRYSSKGRKQMIDACQKYQQMLEQINDELGLTKSINLTNDTLEKIMNWQLPLQLNEQCQILSYDENESELNTIIRSSREECADSQDRNSRNLYAALSFIILDKSCESIESIKLDENQSFSCPVGIVGISEKLVNNDEIALAIEGERTHSHSKLFVNASAYTSGKMLSANEWNKIIRTDPKNKDVLGKCFWDDEKQYKNYLETANSLKVELSEYKKDVIDELKEVKEKQKKLSELKKKLAKNEITLEVYNEEIDKNEITDNEETYNQDLVRLKIAKDKIFEIEQKIKSTETTLKRGQENRTIFEELPADDLNYLVELKDKGIIETVLLEDDSDSGFRAMDTFIKEQEKPKPEYLAKFAESHPHEVLTLENGGQVYVFPSSTLADKLPTLDQVKEYIANFPAEFKAAGINVKQDNISSMLLIYQDGNPIVFRYK